MADFLVFIRNKSVTADSGHWMDAPGEYEKQQLLIDARTDLTAEQKIRAKEKFIIKFASRSQPGDIIAVRPDGFYCESNETTGHGWNHYCFALIRCPKIPYDTAKTYWASLNDGSKPLRKYRYSVAALGLRAGQVMTINKLIDLTKAVVDKNGN